MAQTPSRNMLFALAAGVAGGFLAQAIRPAVQGKARPAVKEAIRAGFLWYEQASSVLGELAETASDLVAEVQAELESERETIEASEPADREQVIPFETRPQAQSERKFHG